MCKDVCEISYLFDGKIIYEEQDEYSSYLLSDRLH